MRICFIEDENKKHWFMGHEAINIYYEDTGAGSPARRLIIDRCVSCGNENWLAEEGYHPEFLMDLSKALLEKARMEKRYADYRYLPMVADTYLS